ncbi:CBS domain-containing protein [Actinoplanes sp. CA-131856]
MPSRSTRREVLIDGRRVRLSDLIEAGLLKVGQELTYRQRMDLPPYHATVNERARLALPDGREYNTPSAAAAAASKLQAVPGWIAWRVGSDGPTLSDLRQQLLKMAASEVPESPRTEQARSRFERLNDLSDLAQAGTPATFTVRELLKLWDFDDRNSVTIEVVRTDLDNHGLTTRPDFSAVSLDRVVALELVGDEEANEPAVKAETAGSIGLTLGNLQAEERGLRWVPPTATFKQAITAMQLDDYSQLAVLENGNLVGAVTWKSIAEAKHYNPTATLEAAIVRSARIFNYDERLLDVIGFLRDDGFIFVRDADNEVSGIITNADVVDKYDETATPFFLIGEVDQELREVILGLAEDGLLARTRMRAKDLAKMTMSDYQDVLQNEECWNRLDWPVDQSLFVARLDQIRQIRNTVAHFNRDPIKPRDVESLRNFLGLIRQCTA